MITKYIEAMNDSLNSIIIRPGQYILVKDTGELYFDSSESERIGIREIIITIDKETANPVNGKFYFFVSSKSLSYYQDDWVDITGNYEEQQNIINDCNSKKHVHENYKELQKIKDGDINNWNVALNDILGLKKGKSDVGHVHNYAGSAAPGGPAVSALKLTTARNISLSGDVSGNASFDGNSNITINTNISTIPINTIESLF